MTGMRTIDADALKDYMRKGLEDMRRLFKDNGKFAEVVTNSFCKDIDEQPTVTLDSDDGWIPCGEGLPDDLEEVNVTWVNHNPAKYYDFTKNKPFSGSAVYYKGEWYWYSATCVDYLAEYGRNEMDKVDDGIEITAWMPLPKPYMGKEGDGNG